MGVSAYSAAIQNLPQGANKLVARTADGTASNYLYIFVGMPLQIVTEKLSERLGYSPLNATPREYLAPNPAYGVITATETFNGRLVPFFSLTLYFNVENQGTYQPVVSFAGKSWKPVLLNETSQNENTVHYYKCDIDDWSTINDSEMNIVLWDEDGHRIQTLAAIIYAMHDPSGYVYDACDPDERIVGATATLQKFVGGEWKEWVDLGKIQENPQITDGEGKFGWCVEEGTYRVLISKDNYINITDNGGIAIANMPDGSFNSNMPDGSEIIVLPPNFDVNIPLKRTEYTLSVNGGTGSVNKAWGSDVTVTADTAPSGLRFKHFIATGLSESTYTINPLTFTMPTNAVTLKAVYENIPSNSVNNRGNTGVGDSSKTPKDDEVPAGNEAEQDKISYYDVPEDAWYRDAVLLVTRKGLFDGVAKNTFSPDTSMTRAMFVTVLARLHGVELSAYDKSTFVDVKANTWYTGAVEWAREAGIVNGVGNNKFAPNDPITREEMAAIFFNYLKIMNITVPKNGSNQAFSDIDTASTWAQESIAYMRSVGIINGVSGNNYAPKAIATRANVSKMFANYFYLMDK